MPKSAPKPAAKAAKTARKPAGNGAKKNGGQLSQSFKLTYATMFNPPDSLHTKYDKALAAVKARMGPDYGMLINNQDVFADEKFDDRSPIDTNCNVGTFQMGTP